MSGKWKIDLKLVEQGDIYFFYKPKKSLSEVQGIDDVSRFYFVLQPDKENFSRFIVMGGKKMPALSDGNKTSWGIIQMVGGRGFASKKTAKTSGKFSRPAGEGIYAVVQHRNHTHLLYMLELPDIPGEVQQSFNIFPEANYIFLSRPIETPPSNMDVPFSNFSRVQIKDLNLRGTEILLVGVGADIGRMGLSAYKDDEDLKSSDIIKRLNLSISRHPANSLIQGNWV